MCVLNGGDEAALAFNLYARNALFSDLKLKNAGPKLSRVKPSLGSLKSDFKSAMKSSLMGTVVEVPSLKIIAMDKKESRTSLYKKRYKSKINTVFPTNPKCPNLHDPFNKGFDHNVTLDDNLSSVRLTFSVSILCETPFSGRNTVFRPFVCDVIEDTTPRIQEISQCKVDVDKKITAKFKVSRPDVEVEFFDQSCSWREKGTISSTSKPRRFQFFSTSKSRPEIIVEVPEYPVPVTAPREVSVRLLPMDGQPPGPSTPFTLLPQPSTQSEDTNLEEEDSYFSMLRKSTENIPVQSIVLRPKLEEECRPSRTEQQISGSDSDEEYRKASQRALVDKLFKSK